MWIVILMCLGPLTTSFLSYSSQLSKNDRSAKTLGDSNRYAETEIENIKLLRKLMENELEKEYERSDDFLIRWLRDYDMDLNSASQALKNNLKWRKDRQIGSILNKTFIIHKTETCILNGMDNTGSPVLIMRPTVPDTRKLIINGMTASMLNSSIQCHERLLQASISPDSKHMTQGTVIMDCQGFSVKQHGCLSCISFYQQSSIMAKMHYPRVYKSFIIINAPSLAKRIVETVSPFMAQYTQKTIKVFGAEKEEWTKYLLSVIPAEQLLEEYGGTKLRNV